MGFDWSRMAKKPEGENAWPITCLKALVIRFSLCIKMEFLVMSLMQLSQRRHASVHHRTHSEYLGRDSLRKVVPTCK